LKEHSDQLIKGLSIGTRLVWIIVAIETLTLLIGALAITLYLESERTQQFQQILFSQSDLIAKEVTLEHDRSPNFEISRLELDPKISYQVVDWEGVVYWDSRDPQRSQQKVPRDHVLFSLAQKSALKRGSTDFTNTENHKKFMGTYRKVLDRYLVLGAVPKDLINNEMFQALEYFLKGGMIVYGLSLILAVLFTHLMIQPIRALTRAVRKIADGQFDFQLKVNQTGEIGALTEAFQTMSERIQMLLAGEAQKSRIEEEVNIAAEVQARLLPPSEVKASRFELQSHYQSATETGGDYWGFIETKTHLLLFVGDVTGHGLPSAFITAGIRGCFSALKYRYQQSPTQIPTTHEILEFANQAVMDMGGGELQMTLFVSVLDLESRKISYSNAGHPPAWIFRKSPEGLQSITLSSKGPRLGESQVLIPGEEITTTLEPDDILFLFSDGLFSTHSGGSNPLDKDQVKEKIIELCGSGATLEQIKTGIEFLLFGVHQGNPPEDDITFCLMRSS
jgi:hypothetical protein